MLHRSLVRIATLALIASACARHQVVIPPISAAVTVVHVARETLASVGATPGLVVVVRDADLPDRALEAAAVSSGPRAGRFSPRARRQLLDRSAGVD
jgi:hypothetical protein